MIRRRNRAEMVSMTSTAAMVRNRTVPTRAKLELHLGDQLGADPAGTDDTEDRRGADVDLEPVEPVRHDGRHHLG
jgi:hypothetical protein